MCKDTTNPEISQEKTLFSFEDVLPDRKIKVDFNAPDISSNGGLVLAGLEKENIARKIARLIPDYRNQILVRHSYEEMVCQRVGQIMCGYEDANDCDRLRHDSALKMSVGRKPSDMDLCSQPTMTRLENHVDKKTPIEIGKMFVKEYVASFSKPPKRVILDVDDTNADTYGAQQLSLFNDYYDEYCYMPLVIFDGMNGKLILPLLRPGRRNKSLNIFGILRRVVEYLHEAWPHTIIELRGDSHFCSHEFMDWARTHPYVRFTTGLSGNPALMKKIDRPLRRAKGDHGRHGEDIRRYYSFDYKAKSWKYRQRVIAKIEVTSKDVNVRFIVTSNRNNKPETVYRRYCRRGTMELLDKGSEILPRRQNVLQFIQGQYLQAVSVCRGLCHGTSDQDHGICRDRSRRLHNGQLHETDNAERGVHCREEDIYPLQLLAESQTQGGHDARVGETFGIIVTSIIKSRSPVCNRTAFLCAGRGIFIFSMEKRMRSSPCQPRGNSKISH